MFQYRCSAFVVKFFEKYLWWSVISSKFCVEQQSFAYVLQNTCSWKFRKFHRKTPLLESVFKKVADPQACNFVKKRLHHRCYLVKSAKFLRTLYYRTFFYCDCFCVFWKSGKNFSPGQSINPMLVCVPNV